MKKYTVFVDLSAGGNLQQHAARVHRALGDRVSSVIPSPSGPDLRDSFTKWAAQAHKETQAALVMGRDACFLGVAAAAGGKDTPAIGHLPLNGGQSADRLGFSSDTDEALRLYAAASGHSRRIDLASVNGRYFISEARFDTGAIDYSRELENLDQAGMLKKPVIAARLLARFALQAPLSVSVRSHDSRTYTTHAGVGFIVSNNMITPISAGAEFMKRARRYERAAMKTVFHHAIHRNERDAGLLGFYAWTGDLTLGTCVATEKPWTHHGSITTLESSAFRITPAQKELEGKKWKVHLDGNPHTVSFPMRFRNHPGAVNVLTAR